MQKRSQQILVSSLGIKCIRWIAACFTQTTSHNDPSSTPVTYNGIIHTDRPSSFTDKLEQVKNCIFLGTATGYELVHTALFTCKRLLQQRLYALQTNRHVRLIYSWRQSATANKIALPAILYRYNIVGTRKYFTGDNVIPLHCMRLVGYSCLVDALISTLHHKCDQQRTRHTFRTSQTYISSFLPFKTNGILCEQIACSYSW